MYLINLGKMLSFSVKYLFIFDSKSLIMKSIALLSALSALVPSALGVTIYLAGDSTMAKSGGGSGTAGGYYTSKSQHHAN